MNQNPNQGWSGDSHTHDVLNVNLNGQDTNGNYSNISVWVSVYHDSGWSESGVFNGQAWVNGGQVLNNNWGSGTIGTGEVTIAGAWGGNVGHDANGNASPYIEYYVNQPATQMTRRGANWGLPRIAQAPQGITTLADTIKPTTARLGLEISSYGHGTSCAMRMYYRKQGDSTWLNTADQSDAAGYNYWTISGLQPGATYEYYGLAYNNNGDTGTNGVQTFKALPAPNSSAVLHRIIGVS
ncbi:MAG TPA: hypothetical protein VN081_02270 [Dongiaceae bacterium]|nr:hypothetical protein [Dongiaceae bacterium]